MFRVAPGVTRRLCQWTIVTLCLMTGLSLWFRDGGLIMPGWAGWLAQCLLGLVAWLSWCALAWPWARAGHLRVVSGRWYLGLAADHPDEQVLRLSSGRLAVFPGLLIVPWQPGRRLWIFADECSPGDWRRLNLCARFSRQGR